jgi:hypothetical protein
MSEIPFLNQLGEEIERAAVASMARRRRRHRLVHPRSIVALAVLAVGGGASAAAMLSSRSTELAANDIVCHEDQGGMSVTASDGRSPVEVCAAAIGKGVSASQLVACAGGSGPNGPYVMVYIVNHPDECRRRGLQGLPASYRSAQLRVSALGQALIAIEDASDCVPVAEFAARAQQVLEQQDWPGWKVRIERVRQATCGTLAEGGAGLPEISGSLEGGARTLVVYTRPPRSLLGTERAVWVALNAASASRCFTPTSLESYAEQLISARGLQGAFAVTRKPPFEGLGGGRQPRYESGCAVMAGVSLAAAAPRIDVSIYDRDGSAPAPQGSSLPETAYR